MKNEVVDITMQLYDQEEIMRVHVQSKCRDVAIQTAVEIYRECGISFSDTVDKIAKKFSMSHERAEGEAQEYWND